jgi:gamma-glutamyltranspeptidase/glutathione hydrolase
MGNEKALPTNAAPTGPSANSLRWPAVRTLFLSLMVGSLSSLQATEGFVTSVQPLATQAGLDALRAGGNAIDAAAAVALTLGVVDGHNSGIGGGCFFLARLADGTFIALDGRETAPAKATRDMYLKDGQVVSELSKTGPLASATPGALAVYDEAVRQHGKLPFAKAFSAGIHHADQGFPIDRVYAKKLASQVTNLALFPSSKAIFLKSDGSPYLEGETIVQKDLAESYRQMAKNGPIWFYQRTFPKTVEKYMKANGGILSAKDFQEYRFQERTPLTSSYRGWTILGFPPPSSGGVHVAQMLNILEAIESKMPKPATPEFIHRMTEVMKLAFADRAYWLGDPAFANVPRGLTNAVYAKELSAKIDSKKATSVEHGTPPDWQNNCFEKHTTHFCVADAEGNWVSCTATVNTAFGSKVVIPGTGILLNNQMDDFAVAPGVPNHFKLVGGEANAISPGKRPLSSMSPTLVMKDDHVVMAIGAAGGPTIISQVLLGLTYALDSKMKPSEVVSQPRFHHQWFPDQIRMEKSIPAETREKLKAMGHTIDETEDFGTSQILIQNSDGSFSGATDPRCVGQAAGTR